MKLTGKCLEVFELFLECNEEVDINIIDNLDNYPTFKNALIIEFFDSVDIYIIINFIAGDFDFEIKDYYTNKTECKRFYGTSYETRKQATEKAIIHAKKIYNKTKL